MFHRRDGDSLCRQGSKSHLWPGQCRAAVNTTLFLRDVELVPIFAESFLALIINTGGNGENYRDFFVFYCLPELHIREAGRNQLLSTALMQGLQSGTTERPLSCTNGENDGADTWHLQIYCGLFCTNTVRLQADGRPGSKLGCLPFPSTPHPELLHVF